MIPILQFAIKRYHFSGWFWNYLMSPFLCFLCCKHKLKGRLEDFKKGLIKEFKENPDTKNCFNYYVLDQDIDDISKGGNVYPQGNSEFEKLNENKSPDLTAFKENVIELEKPKFSPEYEKEVDTRIIKKKENIKLRLKEGKK